MDINRFTKEILEARADLYARLEEYEKQFSTEKMRTVDGETIELLEDLSDDRFSFRDMARSLLEKICATGTNNTCRRLLSNIIEEDVHG